MFKFIGRYIQKKEMKAFLDSLKSQDGRDIAVSVIVSTAYRNSVLKIENINLLSPAIEFQLDPLILLRVGMGIKEKQKTEDYVVAAALMIWLHTIRSITHPSLRSLGRSIWAELARGMACVPELIEEGAILSLLNDMYPTMIFDITGYDKFPIGLTPSPN